MSKKGTTPDASMRLNAVADSEEEDDGADHIEQQRDIKLEPDKRLPPPYATPLIQPSEHQPPQLKQENRAGVQHVENIRRHSDETQSSDPQSTNNASPFQRDSPTKLVKHVVDSNVKELSSSSPAPQNQVDMSRIRSFLAFRPDRTQAFLDDLHRSRRAVATEIFDYNLEGREVPWNLQSKPSELSTKIVSVERLVSLRNDYIWPRKGTDA